MKHSLTCHVQSLLEDMHAKYMHIQSQTMKLARKFLPHMLQPIREGSFHNLHCGRNNYHIKSNKAAAHGSHLVISCSSNVISLYEIKYCTVISPGLYSVGQNCYNETLIDLCLLA